jgi:2-phospho-L-lactate/phosphoenolpyruvate guanylyltransferase
MSAIWTALVPVRFGDNSKTRLAEALDQNGRSKLVDGMAKHVLDVLGRCDRISRLVLLSPIRPQWWSGEWSKDAGRGLNAELTAWRATSVSPLCIVHGDLPLLEDGDIIAILDRAELLGAAMAADLSKTGTNALALHDSRAFTFQFGPNSCERHAVHLPAGAVLQRMGLSTDIDNPTDLEALVGTHHCFTIA